MIKNYLLVAFRNLWRNKTFSAINIIGLSLGLTCSLLILLWVKDERSVDSFHKNKATLYTIIQRAYADKRMGIGYYTPGLLGQELKRQIPEVQYAANYSTWGNLSTFQAGDKIIRENGEYADEDFFKLFSFPLLRGDKTTALNAISNIAISKKMATSFFGSPETAIGHTIRFENKQDFTVSAVFEIPENSSLHFDYLINWKYLTRENEYVKDWNSVAPYTTVMLRPDADPEKFRARIKYFLNNLNTKQGPNYHVELDMQRFDEVYLNGAFKNKQIGGGRIEYVRLFSIIAIFILLIACINFMNLTTARSIKRAKEIGIRKTAGAMKGTLIIQFIGEALLITILSVALSIGLITLTLPFFNELSGKQIQLPFTNISFWLQLTAITLFTGLISGSYPAFFLSSFNPVKVLKGSIRLGTGTALFRKALVTFQFVLSILLIIGTIIISKQVRFIQATNLGFDRENLVTIPLEGALANQYPLFKQELTKMPGIQQVTAISQSPVQIDNFWIGDVSWENKDPQTRPTFAIMYSEYDLVQTMHLQLKEGREFSRSFPTDSTGYILNESAVKNIGIKDPIGHSLTCLGKKGTIIGVVKDFHFNSLHQPISPLVIAYGVSEGNTILIRTKAGMSNQAISSLEKECKSINPSFPFTYQFSDEAYQKLYTNENLVGKLSYFFAFLAIFISCMGLLGLAAFTAEQRGKEIAIRKVLGAGLAQLFILLSGDFFRLVLLAFLIAVPFSWWMMSKWLEDYAYRTEISWWIFIAAGFISLLITLATVSFHVLKAAMTAPQQRLT
jgi:ABC-type antimicrobial peptide transport system permease subunit